MDNKLKTNLSIYIHWPFCLSKCPYCDFNSHVANNIDHTNWLQSYQQELDYFASTINGKYIKSIFFGGGTPSLMQPCVAAGVIAKIAKLGIIDYKTEITLEANPTSFEAAKFKDFKVAGINRVSIGVQALREDDLKQLGRQHSAVQAKKTIEIASTLFSRISFDLIYARSGQTLKAWQEELTEAMELAKGHISLYQLTIEKGTPFYKLFHDGKLTLPDNDIAADMYEWTTDYLKLKNYDKYEISNYATRGQLCQHNLAYWHYNEYLGIGPGAHSRLNNFKRNQRCQVTSIMMYHKPEQWLKSVNELGHGVQTLKQLTIEQTIQEFFMMGLRLKEGVNLSRLRQLTDLSILEIINQKTAEFYSHLGLLEPLCAKENLNIRLTDKGLMLHNYIVPRLLKSQSEGHPEPSL